MESGYSVAHQIPPGFTPDYHPFLFSVSKHLALQGSNPLNFYLLRKTNQKIMAEVSYFVEDGKATSPLRAPFGSFLFSDQVSPLNLYAFVKHCEDQLKKKGVSVITITDPPLYYRKSGELLQTILFNLGYSVKTAELSSGIRIDHAHFEDRIEGWEMRKLRQARDKGAQHKALPLSDLEPVYNFILQCRQQRNQLLSMTLEDLKKVTAVFDKEFFLFGVYVQKELVAASISIKVYRDILYNFYSGHSKKYDSISPVVTLINGMYKYCHGHGIHLLDLGTSAIHGQPNFSLLDFKLRLGALPSMKLTFEKILK